MDEQTVLTERIAEVYNIENFQGITAEMVREMFPDQVASGRVFVVALGEEKEWTNGETGFQYLVAQTLEGVSSTKVSLMDELSKNWSNNRLTFAYETAVEGNIEHSEETIGKYMDDIMSAKLNRKVYTRIIITDSTTPITYVRRDGDKVTIEPRKNRKGEVLVDENGALVYRKTKLEAGLTLKDLPKHHIIPATSSPEYATNADITDFLGSDTVVE